MAITHKPAWAIHLRPNSAIPQHETMSTLLYLRRGNLGNGLLRGGSGPALIAGELRLSHDELKTRARAAADRLAAVGVDKGTHIALIAANSADWIITYLALQLLGAVVIPMNPDYREAEVEHILNDSQAAVAVVDSERQPLIKRLQPRLPTLRQVAGVSDGDRSPSPTPRNGRGRSANPAVLLYTSGTTGRPKGALLDHGNMLSQSRGVIEAWRWSSSDRLVLALPLFHLHGLGMALHSSLMARASIVLVPFTPENVIRELQAGATMFTGVPAMYQRLCDYLEQHPTDLSHVRLFVCGSAPLPPALFERCERLLGQPVLERYGLTEGGIVVSNPYDGPRQPGRVGYPLPGVQVRLGESDEVLLIGPQVFHGYWRNEAATRASRVDGWLRTGDIGEIGEDGSLAIRGRIKEMIISGGFNVYPREVEIVLEQHPAVAEVAVAGRASDRWGEEVTAFVVSRQSCSAEELIAFARERLATYKCPRSVRFIEALPRNAMGKIDRARLR